MATFERRGGTFSQFQLDQGLHQAVALASMTLLITAHRTVMNTGFTLRQNGLSTDVLIVLTIGGLTCIWTLLVLVSGLFLQDKPCRKDFEHCAARLSYAPWIMQILFLFWTAAYVSELVHLRSKASIREEVERPRETCDSGSKTEKTIVTSVTDVEADLKPSNLRMSAGRRVFFRFLKHKQWRMWKMDSSQGHLNWSGSVSRPFRFMLYSIIASVVAVASYAAIRQELYTIGLLNIVGVALFILGAAGANNYATAPHIHTSDTLRIVLHTRHKEGTTYILPTKTRGFDAVWGPKIEHENRALDAVVGSTREGTDSRNLLETRFINYDPVLAAFNVSTDLTNEEVAHLAGWLYEPEQHPQMQKIVCKRAPGLHLIAENVMLSLWHAEYLVMMRLNAVPEHLQKLVGTVRSPRGTGLDLDQSLQQIGSKRGLEGYQEVVRYVYRLFGEPVDQSALVPKSKPPTKSVILDPCPNSIGEYTAQLWDHCFETYESTFAAMCAFCWYYKSDIGNDAPNGWHGFPLRAWDREGDMVTWHIVWRQAWYGAVVAQLTSMSPIILSAFFAGILQ